jgi:hypothetical protein
MSPIISALEEVAGGISNIESRLIEISIGLAAAAIVINTVLSWTIKWKKVGNGNGTGKDQAHINTVLESIYRQPEFVLHAKKIEDVCSHQEKLIEGIEENAKVQTELLASSKRQENLLSDIVRGLRRA